VPRAKGPYLTAEELKRIVHYDPKTGVFRWLVAPNMSVKEGDVACNTRPDGYMALQYKNRLYKAHRLAWLYMTGEWPEATVDHKNRNPSDNRWENLRAATRAQQVANQRVRTKTGYRGVNKVAGARGRPYRAVFYAGIGVGKRKHLGYFATAEEAAAAYASEALARHGEYVCLN
jgi:hypothetical protein